MLYGIVSTSICMMIGRAHGNRHVFFHLCQNLQKMSAFPKVVDISNRKAGKKLKILVPTCIFSSALSLYFS